MARWKDDFSVASLWFLMTLPCLLVLCLAIFGCSSQTRSINSIAPCYELCTSESCVVDCTKLPPYRGGVYLRSVYVVEHGKVVRH